MWFLEKIMRILDNFGKFKRSEDHSGKKKRGKRLRSVLLFVLLILIVLGTCVGFLTDWMWFSELGFTRVFWTQILTEVKLGIPIFIIAGLLVRLYLNSLRKGYFSKIESHEIPNMHRLNVLSWVVSVVFGLIAAVVSATNTWQSFLMFANSTKFGLKDPIFGLDISFYVFKLEFLTKLNSIAIFVIVGVVIVTLIYYAILLSVRTPDIFDRFDRDDDFEEFGNTADEERENYDRSDNSIPFERRDPFEDMARKFVKGVTKENSKGRAKRREVNRLNIDHLFSLASGKAMILGVIFYIMLGIHFVLKQFTLLHAHTGTVYGAGFTDIAITQKAYILITVLSVIGAVTLVRHVHKKEYRKLIRIPAIMIGVLVIGTALKLGVQSLIVTPDEINKESKYIKNNIEYTNHAYGLDKIKVDSFAADNNLTAADIANNKPTMSNIRINDYEPVKDYYNQTQSIRQYYDFNDVDVDRYEINGSETQAYLSTREINENKISDTWINKHLKYTHGYGVALSKVNSVTANGQPDVMIKNIPPESSIPEIKIRRPEIYFGELTNNYIIVNGDEQEFDYPDGNANKYTRYKGKAGIKLEFINRLLFSIREGSMQMLVSSNINKDSRIIINRNILERVNKILPYLDYEKDPYITVVDGKLYWIIDAYTTSSNYPYSEPYSGQIGTTNYIRNSIKVVVDAYNGDVNYYVVDNNDPIAKTYAKIYPTLFKSSDEVPAGIRKHFKYPSTLLNIQSNAYTKYHMNEVKVFYQKEDMWDVAHQIYGTKEKQMSSSFFIFNLPGEKKAEFINMIPFTPKSKQNMTAIMMARNDGDEYGKLVVYKLPKNKTVYGPMQVEAQIDQNSEIAKEFSLWNSSGTTYRRGDMFVIPVNNSIMYVEPVYLEASNQAIPEVRRVIVAYGDKIAYASTLDEALENLFGDGAGNTGSTSSQAASSGNSGASKDELIAKAKEAYDNAIKSQKEGDWKAYGEYLDQLSGYLDQLTK